MFEEVEAGDYFIAPWDSSIEHLPEPEDAASMTALIRAQIKLLRRKLGATVAAGGPIIYADITRDKMTIERFE